jgi:CubicO group peptidase (beta-lactamase class C family)
LAGAIFRIASITKPITAAAVMNILLAQVALDDPVAPAIMRDFWRYAAR